MPGDTDQSGFTINTSTRVARSIRTMPQTIHRILLAQYDYIIGIGDREKGESFGDALDMRIPIALDEYIVSICFADDITQALWSKELSSVC